MSTTRRRIITAAAIAAAVIGFVIYAATDNYVPTRGDLVWWGDLALYSAGPPLIGFVLLYGFRSRWRDTEAGRALFYMTVSLVLLMVLVVLSRLLGSGYLGQIYVRIAGYLIVSVTVWRLLIALIRAQRRKPPPAPED